MQSRGFPSFGAHAMVPVHCLGPLFDLAERNGLAMFPIKAFNKQPTGVVRSHSKDWSKDREQWRRWYDAEQGCNFGIECGPSGIGVADADVGKDGVAQLDQFWIGQINAGAFSVCTPSDGWHVYGRLPPDMGDVCQPDWSRGKINVRAGNGYVVAPYCEIRQAWDPGVKKDGFYRIAAGCVDIGPAPSEFVEHVRPRAPAAIAVISSEGFDEDGYPTSAGMRLQVEAFLTARLADLRAAVPGNRNSTLNEAAFELGRLVQGGQFDRSCAEMLLLQESSALGLGTIESRATIRSGLDGAKGKPLTLRPSLQTLLASPVAVRTPPPLGRAIAPPNSFPEPIVERLLLEGNVTVLSGHSGTGKTTVGASLMAASSAGLRNYRLFGNRSDVLTRAAAWIFLSYEGGQYIEWHRRAWHLGLGIDETMPGRRRMLAPRGPLVYGDAKRNVCIDQVQKTSILREIDLARIDNPGLPAVLVLDNLTSAVQDPTDQGQAGAMMGFLHELAYDGLAVCANGHPPKSGHSAVYGSHLFLSLADIVGTLEVLRKDKGEWVQWIGFDKHRAAPNGRCLELRSRKLDKPIMDLPMDWGDDPKIRDRALEDLKIPYIHQIRVKWESEKEAAKDNVVSMVSPKEAQTTPVVLGNIVPIKREK